MNLYESTHMRLFIEVLLMKMQIRNNKYIFLQYDKLSSHMPMKINELQLFASKMFHKYDMSKTNTKVYIVRSYPRQD